MTLADHRRAKRRSTHIEGPKTRLRWHWDYIFASLAVGGFVAALAWWAVVIATSPVLR